MTPGLDKADNVRRVLGQDVFQASLPSLVPRAVPSPDIPGHHADRRRGHRTVRGIRIEGHPASIPQLPVSTLRRSPGRRQDPGGEDQNSRPAGNLRVAVQQVCLKPSLPGAMSLRDRLDRDHVLLDGDRIKILPPSPVAPTSPGCPHPVPGPSASLRWRASIRPRHPQSAHLGWPPHAVMPACAHG